MSFGAATAEAVGLVEAAKQAGRFDRLVEAIEAAGLAETLKGEGPFTVFAPTDGAFDRLPPGAFDQLLRQPNRDPLATLLKHHVIAGEAIPSDSIPERLTPIAGGPISVALSDRGVVLQPGTERALVVEGDIAADNGIIHAIDAVLVPEQLKPLVRVAGLPRTAIPPMGGLRSIPYEGALPPAEPTLPPVPEMQRPLESWVKAALDVLYQRPMPKGPEPIALDQPRAIAAVGEGPVIQVLPGPTVFADKLPPTVKTALPEKTPFSNNVVELPGGDVRFVAIDRTLNDTKLSEDEMEFRATFTDHEGSEWTIIQVGLAPLSPDPVAEPWMGGVATDVLFHGQTGNGTPAEPLVQCALCSWGWADIWKNGARVASSAPLHVMLTSDVRDDEQGFRYACYECADNPVREIHIIVAPKAGLPAPGGFLHVMWENAEVQRGSPEELADRQAELALDLPTIHLNAVPYLSWSQKQLQVEVGQPVRLVLDNEDPTAFHAFMMKTPQGTVMVPLPHGSAWATTLVFDQPGFYEFMCPVGNHAKRGMHGQIHVTAAKTDGGTGGEPERQGG